MANITPISEVPNRPPGNAPRSIADILADFDHITNYINNTLRPAIPDSSSSDLLQQGVLTGGEMTRDSGTQVTIGAGSGWIETSGGALIRVEWDETPLTVPAGVANGRVDQAVVNSDGIVSRLEGTNAGTAISTLDDANASGSRAAVPSGSMRLSEFVVDNTGVLTDAKLRDRRAWARGAYCRIVRNADESATDDYTTNSTAGVSIDATNLKPRIECTGNPLRVTLDASWYASTNAIGFWGAAIDDTLAHGGYSFADTAPAANTVRPLAFHSVIVPAAGSHLIDVRWATSTGNLSIVARADRPLFFTVEEIMRPNTTNG